jgi:hypothetical protein
MVNQDCSSKNTHSTQSRTGHLPNYSRNLRKPSRAAGSVSARRLLIFTSVAIARQQQNISIYAAFFRRKDLRRICAYDK